MEFTQNLRYIILLISFSKFNDKQSFKAFCEILKKKNNNRCFHSGYCVSKWDRKMQRYFW